MQVLAADLDIVLGLVPVQVVARVVGAAVWYMRVVVGRADRQAGKIVSGVPTIDGCGRFGPVEGGVAAFTSCTMRPPLNTVDHVPRMFFEHLRLDRGVRGMPPAARMNGLSQSHRDIRDRQAVVRRQLVVDAAEQALLRGLDGVGEGLARQLRRAGHDGARLALVFVRREVVQLVLDDRAAEGAADLLIRVGQDHLRTKSGALSLSLRKFP